MYALVSLVPSCLQNYVHKDDTFYTAILQHSAEISFESTKYR